MLIFGDFLQIVKILIFVNQKRHNSAYDNARIAHESSLKSSVFAYLGGLTSFQNVMIFTPATVHLVHVPHVTVSRGYFDL